MKVYTYPFIHRFFATKMEAHPNVLRTFIYFDFYAIKKELAKFIV